MLFRYRILSAAHFISLFNYSGVSFVVTPEVQFGRAVRMPYMVCIHINPEGDVAQWLERLTASPAIHAEKQHCFSLLNVDRR